MKHKQAISLFGKPKGPWGPGGPTPFPKPRPAGSRPQRDPGPGEDDIMDIDELIESLDD